DPTTSAATPPLPRTRPQRRARPAPAPATRPSARWLSALNCPKCGAYKVKSALTLFRGRGAADPQKLENGAWQLAQHTDHPLGPQFCDRVLGIAVIDGDHGNACRARGGDVAAGIADHHRMAYVAAGAQDRSPQELRIGLLQAKGVRATNGGKALGEAERIEQPQRQPFQFVGADRKPTAGGAQLVEGGFQA